MGAQAQGAVGRDGLDAARVRVEAGGLAADAAEGVGAGQVGIALRAQTGVLAAEEADAGRCREGGRGGCVQVQQRLVEALDGVGQCAARCLLGFLPVDAAFVLASGLRIDVVCVLLQGLPGIVAGQPLRALLAGALAERVAQLARGLELACCLGRVHLRAVDAGALCVAGRCRQQEALTCAHHGPAFGVAVKAFAQPLAALRMARSALPALLDDAAQRQFAPAGIGAVAGQAHAKLAGGVVEQPLVGALAIKMRVMPAGDGARVVGACVHARGPGQVVLAVVQLADHDGAVDVAIDEIDEHFRARPWCEHGAPVGARHALGHPHPGAAGVVARRMAGVGAGQSPRCIQGARQGRLPALPRKLNADAVVAVCRERLAWRSHDDGRLQAGGRGLHRRHGCDASREWCRRELVAVAALLQFVRLQDLSGLAAQVVGGLVRHAQDGEAVFMTQAVVGEREARAFTHRPHGALARCVALMQFLRGHQALRARIGHVVAAVLSAAHATVCMAALTMPEIGFERGHLAVLTHRLGLRRYACDLALVP